MNLQKLLLLLLLKSDFVPKTLFLVRIEQDCRNVVKIDKLINLRLNSC